VLKDLAALNKTELQGWDYWGMAMQFCGPGATVPDAAVARLDAVAAITAEPVPDWTVLRQTYERDALLRVPPVVKSFGPTGPKEVSVPT
jgi:hypothetical protein